MTVFIKLNDVRREQFDWGVIGWRLIPSSGAKQLVVMDVELEPGQGHDFHRHPGQEEVIIVKQGRVTQFVEENSTTLGPGDSAFIPENTVHASFNDFDETAYLQVVISPSLGGDTGYGLEDVADQEPWRSLRDR
ncbi:MAG TPA: cupin domain-containing protein [Egibacteraceae bacterium]|nr:cupin domain-containing protein [Egibacteraceae bacterium]